MGGAHGVAAFGLFALLGRGDFWLVLLLTPTALLTVSAEDYQSVADALQPVGQSAAGIVVALGVGEVFWRLAPHEPATGVA